MLLGGWADLRNRKARDGNSTSSEQFGGLVYLFFEYTKKSITNSKTWKILWPAVSTPNLCLGFLALDLTPPILDYWVHCLIKIEKIRVCCCVTLIQAPKDQRQACLCEFEASVVHRASSRIATLDRLDGIAVKHPKCSFYVILYSGRNELNK